MEMLWLFLRKPAKRADSRRKLLTASCYGKLWHTVDYVDQPLYSKYIFCALELYEILYFIVFALTLDQHLFCV